MKTHDIYTVCNTTAARQPRRARPVAPGSLYVHIYVCWTPEEHAEEWPAAFQLRVVGWVLRERHVLQA
jgi:hypothetical protein